MYCAGDGVFCDRTGFTLVAGSLRAHPLSFIQPLSISAVSLRPVHFCTAKLIASIVSRDWSCSGNGR